MHVSRLRHWSLVTGFKLENTRVFTGTQPELIKHAFPKHNIFSSYHTADLQPEHSLIVDNLTQILFRIRNHRPNTLST